MTREERNQELMHWIEILQECLSLPDGPERMEALGWIANRINPLLMYEMNATRHSKSV